MYTLLRIDVSLLWVTMLQITKKYNYEALAEYHGLMGFKVVMGIW